VREQQVFAWAQHSFRGVYEYYGGDNENRSLYRYGEAESCCVVHNDETNEDDVYLIIRRKVPVSTDLSATGVAAWPYIEKIASTKFKSLQKVAILLLLTSSLFLKTSLSYLTVS